MKLWQQLITRLQAIKPRGSTKAPQLGKKLFWIKWLNRKGSPGRHALGFSLGLFPLFVLFVVWEFYRFLTRVSLQSLSLHNFGVWYLHFVLIFCTVVSITVTCILWLAGYFINSWRGEISVWQGGLCIERPFSKVRLSWDEVLDVVERTIGSKNEPTLLILTTKGWLSLPAQSEAVKQLKSRLLNHLKRDHPIPQKRYRGDPTSYLLITLMEIMLLITLYPHNVNFFLFFLLGGAFVGPPRDCVLSYLKRLRELTAYPLRSYGYQRDVFHLSSLIKAIFLPRPYPLLCQVNRDGEKLMAVYKALVLRVLAASASDDVRKIDEKTRRSLHKLLRSETDPEFLCAFLRSYRPLVVPSDAPVMEALVQGKTALGYHAEVAQEAQTCLDVIRELTNPQTLLRAGMWTSEHLLRPASNPTPAENLLKSVTNPSETLEEDRKEPLTPATRLQTESQEQAAS